jgi:glutamate-1-semialdehyde 2,1-aminomutase
MAAGIAQLKHCLSPGFYESLEEKTSRLVDGVNRHAKSRQYAFRMFRMGSIFWLSFSDRESIRKSSEIEGEGPKKFALLHSELLNSGIYLGPSGYEVGFVSAAHSNEDIDVAIEAMNEGLDKIFK